MRHSQEMQSNNVKVRFNLIRNNSVLTKSKHCYLQYQDVREEIRIMYQQVNILENTKMMCQYKMLEKLVTDQGYFFVALLGILARLAILVVYPINSKTFAATTKQKITMIARTLLLKHVMLRSMESGGT